MLKNKIIKIIACLIFLEILAISFSFSGPHDFSFDQNRLFPLASGKLVLLIIHENLIYCPLCQSLLNDFFNIIYSERLENLTIGIYISSKIDTSSKEKEHFAILEKQLRGFIKGNNIRFPVVIDKEGLFPELYFKDVDIIFFNMKKNLLRKYKLPLSKDQRKELISD